jgi:beta-glucosidase
VELDAGDRTTVEFELTDRDFSVWDERWIVPGGEYLVEIGRSAADIAVAAPVTKKGPKPPPLTIESTVEEFLAHPVTGSLLQRSAKASGAPDAFDLVTTMPMRRLLRYPGTGGTRKQIESLVRVANNPVVRAVAGLFRRR